jgi:hypothetical protein
MDGPKVTPSLPDSYQVPEVWEEPQSLGGTFGSINRPTAGSRSEEDLPRGKHDLQIYTLGTPNGMKVGLNHCSAKIVSQLKYFVI